MTDGKINIATGMSARSKKWKNKTLLWSELAVKLTKPNPTNETYKEYMASSKGERSKIKDVGGYVGAYLRGGTRKPENVVHRQLITLDVDFAHLHFWEDLTNMYDNAAVVHATHTHSAETPKYRLIMPIDREVSPDEYAAISRRVAGDLGIDLFDNTGFQPYRLMFWPSSPIDVEFYAEQQDGPWLNADKILGSYLDWRDSSLWPMASDSDELIKRDVDKQEDPKSKKGVVGAFCRTYTIEEAIETFLSDKYTEAAENRYTYLGGSTAGGLVLYGEDFAYSHHGTDPTSGQLCNAFDLVRIHLFGHLDKEANSSKVSFGKMNDLARTDKLTKRTIVEESLESANYDFAEPLELPEGFDLEDNPVEDTEWAEELEVDAKGKYLATSNNLNIILGNDPRLKGIFKHNLFDNKTYVFRNLPWRAISEVPTPLRDVDYSGVRNYIESIYGIVGSLKIDDCLKLEFEKNSFHPVKDYLNKAEWDGTPRIDTMLIEYMGAEDTIYTREATAKFFLGAVARVLNPGCKFDLVLTLVGAQGGYKSMLFKKLGGPWFSDTFMTVQGKDGLEQLHGAWIIEMAELSGLRKAEVEAIKHFITKQVDTFRAAYARTSETHKRQCVFVGTTNNDAFLDDPTGNRRFLPVAVDPNLAIESVPDLDEATIEQMWAEATQRYKGGEPLFLSQESTKLSKLQHDQYSVKDERLGVVLAYVDVKLTPNWENLDIHSRRAYLEGEPDGNVVRQEVCVAEIWVECLGKNIADMDRYKTRSINDMLRSMGGWKRQKKVKRFNIYGPQRYYVRQ